jgi:hypothetical protein
MNSSAIRKYEPKDPRRHEDELEYWQNQSYEARLEAVEILRRQFMKFSSSKGEEEGSPRLHRALRVIDLRARK